MASTLSGPSVSISISAGLSGGASPALTAATIADTTTARPGVGSIAGQVSKVYSSQLTINTASATTLDLTSLTDALGASVSFGKLRGVKITNTSAVAGEDITVGGGSNAIIPAASPLVASVSLDATFAQNFGTVGLTVDSTHKNLLIAAAAGSAVSVIVTLIGQ